MNAQDYFNRDPERDAFYRIFYVAYEQDKARRNGAPLSSVKSFFGDTAC